MQGTVAHHFPISEMEAFLLSWAIQVMSFQHEGGLLLLLRGCMCLTPYPVAGAAGVQSSAWSTSQHPASPEPHLFCPEMLLQSHHLPECSVTSPSAVHLPALTFTILSGSFPFCKRKVEGF